LDLSGGTQDGSWDEWQVCMLHSSFAEGLLACAVTESVSMPG
jgi:hypothetical protein